MSHDKAKIKAINGLLAAIRFPRSPDYIKYQHDMIDTHMRVAILYCYHDHLSNLQHFVKYSQNKREVDHLHFYFIINNTLLP